jgi:hypothetical protein
MAGIARSLGRRRRRLDRKARPNTARTEVQSRDGIEALLRNEFADVERQAIADRRLDPDA